MKAGQGFAKKITSDTIIKFKCLLKTKDEKTIDKAPDEVEDIEDENKVDSELKELEAEFEGEPLKISLSFKRPKSESPVKKPAKRTVKAKQAKVKPAPAIPATPTVPTRGAILWQKHDLAKTDAQRVGASTNPVGGIRLTKAKYKVDRKVIDQTTYFRNDVFGHLPWQQIKASPYTEGVDVEFDITLLGKHLGTHTLTVRHKPSGEAGQHNYTAQISWGEVGEEIRQANIIGKTFTLLAPVPGTAQPFFIEVT